MEFYYINTKGEIIDFSCFPYLFQEGNLINTSWKYSESNGRIINVNRGIGERDFELAVLPDYRLSISERIKIMKTAMDRIYEVFDYDVVNNSYGRLYCDTGYYLCCQIISSAKSKWNSPLPYNFQTFKVLSETNLWFKEFSLTFITNAETNSHDSGYDYAYDYAYDYNCTHSKQSFQNNSFIESNFIMKIQGTVISPKVYINNHLYSVDVTLEAGDILEINSINNTITLTKSNGEIENCFDLRNRSSHIFKKIAAGTNTLVSNQKLSVMLTYFDERGEPRWS